MTGVREKSGSLRSLVQGGPRRAATPKQLREGTKMTKIVRALKSALAIRPKGVHYWWGYHQI